MVEIRVWALMFRRGVGNQKYKGYLHMTNTKERMRIYLCEVINIGIKTIWQRWKCALEWWNGETAKQRNGIMV